MDGGLVWAVWTVNRCGRCLYVWLISSAVYIHSPLSRYVASATSLVRCFAGEVRRLRDLVFFVLCSGYALVMLWLCSGYRAELQIERSYRRWGRNPPSLGALPPLF